MAVYRNDIIIVDTRSVLNGIFPNFNFVSRCPDKTYTGDALCPGDCVPFLYFNC